jgi:hypothetical protein
MILLIFRRVIEKLNDFIFCKKNYLKVLEFLLLGNYFNLFCLKKNFSQKKKINYQKKKIRHRTCPMDLS